MAINEAAGLQQAVIQPRLTWDQFQHWYTGYEHLFKHSISGPTTGQLNEIRRQLDRVRSSDAEVGINNQYKKNEGIPNLESSFYSQRGSL